MSRRAALIVHAFALVACAKIVGLQDSSDPASAASTKGGPDAGPTSLPPNAAGAVISYQTTITMDCGATDDSGYVSIENTTEGDLPFEVDSPVPNQINLKDDSGAVGPKATGTVGAHKTKIFHVVIVSPTPGPIASALFVSTDKTEEHVPVNVTVKGALLKMSPPLIDFGEVKQNTDVPTQDVEITNAGNVDITYSWPQTSQDFAMPTASVTLKPNEKKTASAKFNSGIAGAPLSVDLAPQTLAPTCTAVPTLTLKGSRVDRTVTTNPGSVAFDRIPCSSSPGDTREITLTNYGPTPATYQVSLPTGSAFTVGQLTGTVPGASTAKFAIGLRPVSAAVGDHAEDISVKVVSDETTTTNIHVALRVVGAVVDSQPTTFQPFGKGQTRTLTLHNSGNDFVFLKTTSSDGAFSISADFSGGGTPLDPGSSQTVDVKLSTTTQGNYTSTISTVRIDSPFLSFPPLPDSGRLCNTINPITATGTVPPP